MKTGFIALVGPSNSGKSTLLNRIIGQKISIVSPKPQTTYHCIRGVLNQLESQIVLLDTPGFCKRTTRFLKTLNDVAEKGALGCERLVWVFDVSNPYLDSEIAFLKKKLLYFKLSDEPICLLNKIDRVAKPALLPWIEKLNQLQVFSDIIPISALKGIGLDRFLKILNNDLKESPPLYPTDQISDRNDDFIFSELIREKIYHLTRKEIPYSTRVSIDETSHDSKIPFIYATIHVDSESRKGILIGRGGELLKRIGTQARQDIELQLKQKICLKLHVSVEKNWRDNLSKVNSFLEVN